MEAAGDERFLQPVRFPRCQCCSPAVTVREFAGLQPGEGDGRDRESNLRGLKPTLTI